MKTFKDNLYICPTSLEHINILHCSHSSPHVHVKGCDLYMNLNHCSRTNMPLTPCILYTKTEDKNDD